KTNYCNNERKSEESITRRNNSYVNNEPIRFQNRHQRCDLRVECRTSVCKAHHNNRNHKTCCRNQGVGVSVQCKSGGNSDPGNKHDGFVTVAPLSVARNIPSTDKSL